MFSLFKLVTGIRGLHHLRMMNEGQGTVNLRAQKVLCWPLKSPPFEGGDFRSIERPLPLSDGFRDRREVASRKAETNEAGGSAIAGKQHLAVIPRRYRQELIQKSGASAPSLQRYVRHSHDLAGCIAHDQRIGRGLIRIVRYRNPEAGGLRGIPQHLKLAGG